MMRVLASVWRGTHSVTAQGGMAVFYEAVGSVWLMAGARRRKERDEAGVLRVVETMKAQVRPDPRLEEGQQLRFAGARWAVVAVDPSGVARWTLELERQV